MERVRVRYSPIEEGLLKSVAAGGANPAARNRGIGDGPNCTGDCSRSSRRIASRGTGQHRAARGAGRSGKIAPQPGGVAPAPALRNASAAAAIAMYAWGMQHLHTR